MLALLVLSVLGCTSAAQISAERRERALAEGHPRIVVVPTNLAVVLAAGLEPAVDPVQTEILGQLQDQGAEVGFLAIDDARKLWARTVETVRSMRPNTATLDVVTGTFVRSLASQAHFDLLVMPALGYRQARVEGKLARWDGVQRVLDPRTPAGLQIVPAFSLHVDVYMPDGRLWYQRWAGLDLVYYPDLGNEPVVRPDYLKRYPERIQECVTLALQPLG